MSDSLQPHGLLPTRLLCPLLRQEYWSGLPFPSPGDLPHPGVEPTSPALAGRFFTTEPPGKSLDAFSLVITEIVIITYSLTGSSKFRLSVCISPFSSVAAGFCVYESPAPTGSGGAAQEEMLHCALLPQSQFRCVPAVSCSQLAFRVPGLLF